MTAPAEMLTVLDAANALRVGKQTVYRMIWDGELGYTNIAKKGAKRARIRISPSALKKYLSARERAS